MDVCYRSLALPREHWLMQRYASHAVWDAWKCGFATTDMDPFAQVAGSWRGRVRVASAVTSSAKGYVCLGGDISAGSGCGIGDMGCPDDLSDERHRACRVKDAARDVMGLVPLCV